MNISGGGDAIHGSKHSIRHVDKPLSSAAAPGCLLMGGGGAKWQNVSLSTAPALKKTLSGGGGGGTPTHFSDRKIVVAELLP